MLYTASFYHQEHWEGKPYRISRAHPRGQTIHWEVQPFMYPSRPLLTAYQDGAVDFDGGIVLVGANRRSAAEEHGAIHTAEQFTGPGVIGGIESKRLGWGAGGDERLNDAPRRPGFFTPGFENYRYFQGNGGNPQCVHCGRVARQNDTK